MKISEYYRTQATGVYTELMPRHVRAADFFVRQGCREILDIGGNSGLWAACVHEKAPHIAVDSAELSEDLVRTNTLVRNCYNFDATEPWPLPADSYDGMHLGAIVEHIFDYPTMFSECFRVLRPGGHIYISTPNMAGVRHRVQVLLGRMPGWYTLLEHIRPWTGDFLISKLNDAGFVDCHAEGAWEMLRPTMLHRLIERVRPLMCGILLVHGSKPKTAASGSGSQRST